MTPDQKAAAMRRPAGGPFCLEGPAALALLADDFDGGDLELRCPSCGFNYTHIERAGTLTGSDNHEAVQAYPGTQPVGRTGERRSAVQILCNCEGCDDLFALVVQQHKGINRLYFVGGISRASAGLSSPAEGQP